MANVLRTTMEHYDGGYVMCGLTGSGEMFAVRDPWGIRPAFYYRDDEMVAVASERPVLQTTFDLQADDISELKPGESLIVRRNGESHLEQIMPAQKLNLLQPRLRPRHLSGAQAAGRTVDARHPESH